MLAVLVNRIKPKELILLLVVVVRANHNDDEHCEEDSEALNPR